MNIYRALEREQRPDPRLRYACIYMMATTPSLWCASHQSSWKRSSSENARRPPHHTHSQISTSVSQV